jgi:small subunit ribosomal protein S6
MKNNVYESAVLINAALDDEQIESVIARIKEVITNNGGEIREIENWGRKRLAYMVKKSKIGYYAIFRFNAPSSLVSKLERHYTFDEHILRFLTITLDNDALEHLGKNRSSAVFTEVDESSQEKIISEESEIETNLTKEIE